MSELAPRLVEKGSRTVGSDATQHQQTIEAMREQHTIQAQHAAVRASGLCAVQAASRTRTLCRVWSRQSDSAYIGGMRADDGFEVLRLVDAKAPVAAFRSDRQAMRRSRRCVSQALRPDRSQAIPWPSFIPL